MEKLKHNVYFPTSVLKPIVQRYEIFHVDASFWLDQSLFFLPGFTNGILFLFNDEESLMVKNDWVNGTQVPNCSLVPTITIPTHNMAKGNITAIKIVLQPGALFSLYKLPMAIFLNKAIDLSYAADPELKYLHEKLAEQKENALKIEVIESYIFQKLRFKCAPNPLFIHLNQFILDRGYPITVKEFAHVACKSERQFNRILKKEIGVNSSDFLRIHRFNQLMISLNQRKRIRLAQFALDFGFTDQAHFNREFKRMTQHTPLQYLKSIGKGRLLDDNFSDYLDHGGITIKYTSTN